MQHEQSLNPTTASAAEEGAGFGSSSQVSYSWDIESDLMSWSGDPAPLFELHEIHALRTGTAFAALLDPASPTSRHAEIFENEGHDSGTGVVFAARYLVNPAPGVRFWVEDAGRWFANAAGRPRLVHGVCRRVIAPTSQELALASRRQFDPATGALTRADFGNALARAIEDNAKDTRGLVLMLVSINDLAQFNRQYGYHVGDEVIGALARRLRALVRRRDILGRYAVDKIGLVLAPSLAEHMEYVANRLITGIRATPIETSAGPLSALVHIGGVAVPAGARSAIEAFHACEEALTAAAERHDTPFVVYASNPHMREQRSTSRCQAESILSALNERRIRLAFQPIVSTRSGKAAMYESLVRMLTPEGEVLGAAQIVPAASRLGFLHLIDHRVSELVIDALRQHPEVTLSVNVGASTALHPDWLAALQANLAQDPAVARRLIIEITEASLIEDIASASRLIECIKHTGARVAIDDFGAGHTSFRNMRLLPIDMLKIDGTFIKNLARSPDDRFFVQTLLQLARHLKIETVAEWVQDEETAALLSAWRVEYLQGDFLGAAQDSLPSGEAKRSCGVA